MLLGTRRLLETKRDAREGIQTLYTYGSIPLDPSLWIHPSGDGTGQEYCVAGIVGISRLAHTLRTEGELVFRSRPLLNENNLREGATHEEWGAQVVLCLDGGSV